ncbi:MAG: hypothetical protein KY410_08400 [Proteobacteria bacterium]|nr:hypothetical protein [Pseudomonadota bacterium]
MNEATRIANGLYRLIKREEDHNPVFPSDETVVEIRDGIVINLSTGRHWPLESLGSERTLYGPIKNPYDLAPLERLPRIDLPSASGEALADPSQPAEE